jgi:hypothetical protein
MSILGSVEDMEDAQKAGHPRATKAMRAAGEYWIVICANCRHPGGVHVIDQWEPRITHCRCCPGCPGYVDGDYGRWSNAIYHRALSAMTRQQAK